MNQKPSVKRILLACLGLVIFAACHSQAATHILFIGNSFTYFNKGLDKQLEGLEPSAVTARIVAAGYTLEQHWNGGKALQKLHERKWDYVVLQEQSQFPVVNQQKFYEFARKFDQEIRRSGARTVLLMTWERPDSVNYGVTTANMAASFAALGAELGARVAPAGSAFARALRDRPGLALYVHDGHPTAEGTYLATCVLYRTIFGRSPVGNAYSENNISAGDRGYLQRIAAENLRN
jgi:hypothetical protein